jgi:hypothetical protein
MCGKKPCWAVKKTYFTYKDAALTSDGALTAKLASGIAGRHHRVELSRRRSTPRLREFTDAASIAVGTEFDAFVGSHDHELSRAPPIYRARGCRRPDCSCAGWGL